MFSQKAAVPNKCNMKDLHTQSNRSRVTGIVLPVTVAFIALFTMAFLGYFLREEKLSLITISPLKLLNFTFTMQFYALPLSFAGLLFVWFNDRSGFRSFFRFSLKTTEGQPVWETWALVGLFFAFGLTFMMAMNVISNHGTINSKFFELLPYVVLFSVTNAWTEEILSRFVIVAGLSGKVGPGAIRIISAVLFGGAHFMGTPGGFPGMLMTGVLGWFLAKSVIDTKSMGWALLIHFVLDFIIFGAGAMIIAGV
jgi:membrane protease YdiL (CAAX protease family)